MNPNDIYESAFISEKWPDLLGEFAIEAGAIGGGLLVANGEVQRWTACEGLKTTLASFVEKQVLQNMGRKPRIYEAGQHGFIAEHDVFSDEELDAHPLYRDFLRPQGLGWSARTSIRLPTGDNIIITVERAFANGPVPKSSITRMNAIRPHLAISALIAARMKLESARAQTDALAMLGLPALVFDGQHKVLAANVLMDGHTSLVQTRAFGRVALKDKRADAFLRQAVVNAAKQNFAPPYSFSVCGENGEAQMVGHVIPICGESRDVFVQSAGIFVLTPIVSQQLPSADLVQSLFDLTTAEARVARAIAKGDTVEEIAGAGQNAISTVRAQVRSILDKTGCDRQVEVANLLNGLVIVRN